MDDLTGPTTPGGTAPGSCAAGCASRRAVLAGVAGAAALLAGCQTYGQSAEPDPAAAPDLAPTGAGATPGATEGATPGATGQATPGTGATGAGGTTQPAPPPNALVDAANVPVGGGVVLEGERLVVTQPQQGVFKAFSAVCTHQGCVVSSVANGVIECGCHGSRFRATDGSVAGGPANRPLREIRVKETAGKVVRA
ncbi:Rieske (2Fe-2S) protein [Catellatospora sp. NPDC049609]|uniref:Rieske (2Fe-2S) protein n=1 Tax=Catellatospora sp. NPDC049609 TaxID=3155505 RepID=UPI0034370A1F